MVAVEMSNLTGVGPALWIAEGAIVSFYGFAYPTRSAIIRLANGDLWVWSPIRLTADLKREIDALGPVKHLVSPNKLHHLYLQDWVIAYPDSKLWGPASTVRKRRDLPFQAPLVNEPPPEWRDQIDQVWFRGSFLLDEMEFHHPSSATVLIADMSQNFSQQFIEAHWKWWQRPIARACRITKGKGFAPLEIRLSCMRRSAAKAAVRHMLLWQPQRVIMAHGDCVNTNGQAYLRRAFLWLEA
jgi:hypothetical protein